MGIGGIVGIVGHAVGAQQPDRPWYANGLMAAAPLRNHRNPTTRRAKTLRMNSQP